MIACLKLHALVSNYISNIKFNFIICAIVSFQEALHIKPKTKQLARERPQRGAMERKESQINVMANFSHLHININSLYSIYCINYYPNGWTPTDTFKYLSALVVGI